VTWPARAYRIARSPIRDVNVYVAAWLLKQKMVKYGPNTGRAIGAYHSESPKLRDAYARSIQKILVTWGELQVASASQ